MLNFNSGDLHYVHIPTNITLHFFFFQKGNLFDLCRQCTYFLTILLYITINILTFFFIQFFFLFSFLAQNLGLFFFYCY